MKPDKWLWIVIFAILFILLNTFPEDRTVSTTFFNGQIVVERARHDTLHSDTVTFVFTEPGDYIVVFFPKNTGDSVPKSFIVTVTDNDIPLIKVVKKHSIDDLTIAIVKGGQQEIQDLLFP